MFAEFYTWSILMRAKYGDLTLEENAVHCLDLERHKTLPRI